MLSAQPTSRKLFQRPLDGSYDQQEGEDQKPFGSKVKSVKTDYRLPRIRSPALVTTEPNVYDDEEGDALLLTTAHIWKEPLQNYALTLHAKRQRLEKDFEQNEESRNFIAAARVVEFSQRRIVEMQEKEANPVVEGVVEGVASETTAVVSTAAVNVDAEAIRRAKEVEKEEKRIKRKETDRKARIDAKEETKRRKEKEETIRKARAEELRLTRLAEAHRRAALTPEGRALEDQAIEEQAQRDRAAKMLELAGDVIEAEGRGARTKRKRESNLEEDAARALSGLASLHGAHGEDTSLLQDEDEAFDDGVEYSGASKKAKGKATARRSNQATPIDEYGTLLSDLPPGSYLGPNGIYYDADNIPIEPIQAPSPPSTLMQAGYDSVHEEYGPESDGDDEDYGAAGEDEDLPIPGRGAQVPAAVKKSRSAIEALEKKVWTQIAKRDILKVRADSFC